MKRTLPAAVAASLVVLSALSVVPAGAATTADAPWSGYQVAKNGTASGGWLGARRAGGQVVYRIDPSRTKTVTGGFRTAGWQGALPGTGPRRVTATDTSRAAWIVGKYGSYRYAVQNAAVEVALDELLHGGSSSLAGTTTRQRLAQSGRGSAIRSFAATMLRDSARFAGPYTVKLTSTPTPAGGTAILTVSVVASTSGAGIAHLPVSVTYSGEAVSGVRTDSSGSVSIAVPVGAAGPHPVTARVDRIPEARLLVRAPTTAGASRVVVAGQKASRTVTGTLAVQAAPQVTSASTSGTITTGQSPAGHLTLSGTFPSARSATATLYGPFGSAQAATCRPAYRAASRTVNVVGDGTYAYPALTVPRYGYYLWGATVPGDAYNLAASTCAGSVLARVVPTLAATPTGTSYRAGAFIHGLVTVGGLPSGYAGNATLRLYGPFASASETTCDPARLRATQTVAVPGDGTYSGPTTAVTQLGYYIWAADLPASTFSTARTTSCSTSGAAFRVVW